MAKFTLLISGCRHYTNYFDLAKRLDNLISRMPRKDVVIIEGGANGTDYLAFIYALRRGIKCITVPAEWDKLGPGAGYIRNDEMMKMATHCAAFWDGESKGTAHVVSNIHRYPVSFKVFTIPKQVNKYEKPRRRHRSCRQYDGRTLSRIRQRHAHSSGFRKVK